MLIGISSTRPSRLAVVAYDIRSGRRAQAVRRVLDAVNHAKQYSVYEAVLGPGELRQVLADLKACCDCATDRLAAWCPVDGMRLAWRDGGLKIDGQFGGVYGMQAGLRPSIGNFMLCYDISDAAALRAVAAAVAAESAMVQRSVYWLRGSAARLSRLLSWCQERLASGDRLWAYPLGASRGLWRMGVDAAPSVLPIATHHW